MRVDKYLWAIRVFKTRSLASSACREGKVVVGDSKVKPARMIKEDEIVHVRKGAVTFSYKVIALPKSRVGATLVKDYSLEVTPQSELDKLEMIRLQYVERPKGLGRPTKRDRRDWGKAFGDD
jgi:ribosome-associated heat shock protein Hsp15